MGTTVGVNILQQPIREIRENEQIGNSKRNSPAPKSEFVFRVQCALMDPVFIVVFLISCPFSLVGRLYLEQDNGGQPFGPLIVKGDIVGCGIDSVNQRVFFTRNGLFLKEAVSGDWVGRQPYYPTVGVA